MGLRERKKQETRTALSWAAIRLIVERGYDNVLVEDIASEAGVSPRTFNNYFSSKAEAVAARHLDRTSRMADDLRARPSEEPLWTAITAAALAQIEPGPEVLAHPALDQATWSVGLQRMLAAPAIQAETLRASYLAEQTIAEAIAERTGLPLDESMYPKLVAATLTAVVNVASAEYARPDRRADMRTLLTDALNQVAAGLPQPPPPS